MDEGKELLKLSENSLGKEAILTIGTQMALAEGYANINQPEKAIELCNELLTFSLIQNNDRFKQRVTELLDTAKKLELKNQ